MYQRFKKRKHKADSVEFINWLLSSNGEIWKNFTYIFTNPDDDVTYRHDLVLYQNVHTLVAAKSYC